MNDQQENNEEGSVNIEPSWFEVLMKEFVSEEFKALKLFLLKEKETHTIFPRSKDIFKAFDLSPFYSVKVVILGQDPYHGPGQAHGLCFSVEKNTSIPPSLRNIYKEMANEFETAAPNNGDLSYLAEQGILLLNTTLTVRSGHAGSHQGRGWERFTDSAISALSQKREGLIFILWGRFAQKKRDLIDQEKHHILSAPHPSPLSAFKGFFGCGHFNEVNIILRAAGKDPINWFPE